MKPTEIRLCREVLGMTMAEFAKALGVTPMTISHYERGFRHDDQRPVVIPKTVELACAALWLGVTEFNGSSIRLESNEGEEKPERLPPGKVQQHRIDHALRLLKQRGHDLGAFQMAFPLRAVVALWGEVNEWCQNNVKEGYRLHSVVRGLPGEGIGIMTFESTKEAALFKTFWVG